jgi:hypothetical protein
LTSRKRRAAGTVYSMADQLEHLDQHQTTESHDAVIESHDAVIADALAVIDESLRKIMGRELVSSVEVADVLLDVRTLLTSVPAEPV